MIAAFSSADQLRRRPAPVNTSMRRTGSGICLCSEIDMCRSLHRLRDSPFCRHANRWCPNTAYDVSIVEARGRVGGRVITFDNFIPGRYVEGGGEFIGRNQPTWMAYAQKFGLEFLDVTDSEEDSPIVIGGKLLSENAAVSLWNEMDEA